jgi:hypothetical protein
VSGQFHTPAALPSGKEPPLPIGYVDEWAPEPKFLILPGLELRENIVISHMYVYTFPIKRNNSKHDEKEKRNFKLNYLTVVTCAIITELLKKQILYKNNYINATDLERKQYRPTDCQKMAILFSRLEDKCRIRNITVYCYLTVMTKGT